MHDFIHTFPKHILHCFTGKHFFWHILTFVLTYGLVISGFDWWYFTATRNHFLQMSLLPAVMLGGVLPLIIPPTFFIFGKVTKNKEFVTTAWALAQAAFIGLLVSWFYKSLTGRIEPPLFSGYLIDNSKDFLFGFFRHGVFWGWPSSHTTVAFSMSVAFFMLFPKYRHLGYIVLLYALYVGIAVSTNIHWFSDFIAGAIFGTLVGAIVGKGFYEKLNAQ